MNNSSLSPTVSTSVGVSVSTETSATASTEKTTETTTTPKKPQFQKKQSLWDRISKPKKNPTQPPTKTKIPLHLIIIIFSICY